jgi:hypothetical protein
LGNREPAFLHAYKKCFAANEREKDLVRTGTRTQNLLLRRQAPYPLGHTDNYEFCFDQSLSRTRHSSLGVEHSLSKRKVVGSNPACGSQLLFVLVFVLALWARSPAQFCSFDNQGTAVFGWCSWLSRQSNTLKVPSSILGSNISQLLPRLGVRPPSLHESATSFLASNTTSQKLADCCSY